MLSEWLLRHLVCPRDRAPLDQRDETLVCPDRHVYPIVHGVPVLLVDEVEPTNPIVFTETRERLESGSGRGEDSHAFVQAMMQRTCGNLYTGLKEGLPRFPIPEIRLPPGDGKMLLDVGCNWGRWSVAASRKGYRAVGVDPNLNALIAARGVADQMGADPVFVCGDARCLPFADDSFDTIFSYSVLQHFAKDAAKLAMKEMARVSRPGSTILVQMANKFGVRQIFQRTRRMLAGTRTGNFVVRPWSPNELRAAFESLVGPSRVFVDGFFSLNPQVSDLDILPRRYAAVVSISEVLRQASDRLPMLGHTADSLYIEAANDKAYESSSRA